MINYDHVEEIAKKEKPKLLICGASAYSREWDYERLREIADEVGALLLADIAHPAGLIARGLLNDPLDFCHIVTTTTHKTLRGPRGGMIMLGDDFDNPFGLKTPKGELRKMSSLLDSGVFPGTQGGPLEHVIAAKAVAFGEALSDEYMEYVIQVKKNAAVMSQIFINKGYQVISGGTDNHLMLIDLRSKGDITGKDAEEALIKADITINKNMVPFDSRPAMHTSGIRVGTAAITSRGFKEQHCEQVVEWMDDAIMNRENETIIKDIRNKVNHFMLDFPLYP